MRVAPLSFFSFDRKEQWKASKSPHKGLDLNCSSQKNFQDLLTPNPTGPYFIYLNQIAEKVHLL